MANIFISYSHEDQAFVRRIAAALEAEGLSVWWDHTIPPGQSWDSFIARGIREAGAAIIVWSAISVESDWVKEEATIARQSGKYLPVQIGAAEPPLGFSRIQAANLSAWSGDRNDPQWRMLVGAAQSLLTGRAAPHAPMPGAAPPRAASEPPPTPRSGPPMTAIAIVAIVALVGLGGFVLQRLNAGSTTTLDTPPPAAEGAPSFDPPPTPQPTTLAPPAVDPAQQAEIERLQRERENQAAQIEALRREREAQAAELQRIAEQKAAVARPAAPRVAGVWTAIIRWPNSPGPVTVIATLADDGTWRTDRNEPGTWTTFGDTLVLRYTDPPHSVLTGQVSGNQVSGTAVSDYSARLGSGTFTMSR